MTPTEWARGLAQRIILLNKLYGEMVKGSSGRSVEVAVKNSCFDVHVGAQDHECDSGEVLYIPLS